MTDTGRARLITSAAEIGAAQWNHLANPHGVARPHPFTTFAFFHALEASGSATAKTGWQPCHLLIEGAPPPGRASAPDGGGDRSQLSSGRRSEGGGGIMPLYLKSHSLGEYVFDQGWAEALEGAGGAYYPKLQSAVPFTPVTGPRLLAADDNVRQLLLRTATGALKQLGASSLHITFPTEQEWRLAGDNGYLLREGRQFHWENPGYRNFAQFLGELSSAKRKTIRKERASVHAAGIQFDWLTGPDLTEAHWDRFFDFYMDTGARKWGTPYLTREFFSRLGEGLADQILLIMARRGSTYIAGALNLFGENVLFGRNWGAVEYVPFLHFETCYYQAMEFAIAHNMNRVEAGAQGEHKLLRGYMPTRTFSAHLIAHPGLRQAVDRFLDAERQAVQEDIAELATHGPYHKGP